MKKLLAVLAAFVMAFSFGVFADNHEEVEVTMDIVATASADTGFSTLVELVVLAGLEETLAGTGPFTVFAPRNEAFAALDTGTVEYLTSTGWADDLASILTLHVVSWETLAADITGGLSLMTLNGQDLVFSVSGDVVMVNGATVVATDIMATNGIIHVIDTVLIPAEEETTQEDDTERVEGGLIAVELQTAIDFLYENGLTMFGTEETFMGEQSLRRDEAAAFFARFARDVLGMEVDADASCAFSDLAMAHQDLLGEIEAACQLGLMRGHDGEFMPTATFSNAHAMTVLVRLLMGDQEEVEGNWAANYAAAAQEAGLTASLAADMEANLYAPISRADVAKMIEAAAIVHAQAAMASNEEEMEEESTVETGTTME